MSAWSAHGGCAEKYRMITGCVEGVHDVVVRCKVGMLRTQRG